MGLFDRTGEKEIMSMDMFSFFKTGFQSEGIPATDDQLHQFVLYAQRLQEWNQRINLTSIDDTDGIFYRHFMDSLSGLSYLDFSKIKTCADVGTGAGFPGLPLKIMHPALQLTLIESTHKKTVFLHDVADTLHLDSVHIHWGRAEHLKNKKYDLITARAVAKLPELLGYAFHLVKPGGQLMAYKQADIAQELEDVQPLLKRNPGTHVKVHSLKLFSGKEFLQRTLVIFQKALKPI